jgi:phospholipase/lecithinase/hemolysin
VDTVSVPWITSANQAKYISSDGTHPIQIGHDYFGHRLAAAIATATRVTF